MTGESALAATPVLARPLQRCRDHRQDRRHRSRPADALGLGRRRRDRGRAERPLPRHHQLLIVQGVGIWGINEPVAWAFAITNFVWWVGIGHAGTFISAFLLLLRQRWRTSINRFAEAMTIFAVAMAGLMPILHLGRPWFFYWLMPYPNIMNLWPQWRSPLVWDIFAISTYVIVSILFWYMGLIPDLATLRDSARKRSRRSRTGLFALGWRGDARHWARFDSVVPADGGARHAAGDLGAQRRLAGFRHRQHAGMALDDLPAVFRRRRALLRLRDGADARHSACAPCSACKSFITERHLDNMAKLMLVCSLIVTYSYLTEIVHGVSTAPTATTSP